MTTLTEAKRDEVPIWREVPRVRDDGEEFAILWHCNYYDGPLSGVGVMNGKKVWFDIVKEGRIEPDSDGYPQYARVMGIVELTDQEYEEMLARRTTFANFWGMSPIAYGYTDKARERVHGVTINRTREEVDTWYKANPYKEPAFGDKPVVAWWGFAAMDFDAMILDAEDDDA